MREQAPSKERFRHAGELKRHGISACVVEMRSRSLIEIEDYGCRIGVADARALRDWLNKVLPESAPEPPAAQDMQCWVEGSKFKWTTDGGGERDATPGEVVMWAEIERLRAAQPPPVNEVAWLIEMPFDGEAHWWFGSNFTKNIEHAVRFSRQQDANTVIMERGLVDAVATEHMWCSGPTKPDEQP